MNRSLCAAILLAAGTLCTSTHAATGGPPRACCLTDGTCLNVTPDICEANGGVVYPEGVWCNTVECPLPEPESCCDFGKPSLLVMQYTGEDCSASAHSQSADKVNCEGDPAFAAVVRILATDRENLNHHKTRIWFDGEVVLDDTFEIDSINAGKPKLGAKTFLRIYDLNGELLQLVEFHSSCSQPLNTGDQFGSVILIECATESDPPPGGGGDNGLCDDGKPRALEMIYTGSDCSATSHSQDPEKVQCDGDAISMPVVRIVASSKENPNDHRARIWFDDEVIIGTSFFINAENAGKHKLKSRTYVFVYDLNGDLLQFIEFHTSCSQPLFVDDQFGSLKVESMVIDTH